MSDNVQDPKAGPNTEPDNKRTRTFPTQLQEAKRWVNWVVGTDRKGKKTKVPTIPHTSQKFSTYEHPEMYATYADIKDEKRVGFILGENFTGLDFDGCVNEKLEIDPRVKRILKRFPTYAELSPSKTGLHLIYPGTLPGPAIILNKGSKDDHRQPVELYGDKRFFTMTGWHLQGTPSELPANGQQQLNELYHLLSTPLGVFELFGMLDGEPEPAPKDEGTRHPVICPWEAQHTNGHTPGEANIFTRPDGSTNAFHCQHKSHGEKTLEDVYEWIGLDRDGSLVTTAATGVKVEKGPLSRLITFDEHNQFSFLARNVRWAGSHGLKAQIILKAKTKQDTFTLYDGYVYPGSLSDKEKVVNMLAAVRKDFPWSLHVGDFFSGITDFGRTDVGEPIMLADVPPDEDIPYVMVQDRLPILTKHMNMWFGDGESFKSMLALWTVGRLALDHGLKVMFADWELDATDHQKRLKRLFPDKTPDILYVHGDAPILEMAERLGEIAKKNEIDFLLVDSVAFAVMMDPSSAEAANVYMQAIRQIGVKGSLSIAHQTKQTGKKDRGKEKPFGSIFWHNNARLSWYMQAGEVSDDGSVEIALGNRKANITQHFDNLAVTVDFGPGTDHTGHIEVSVDEPSDTGLTLASADTKVEQKAKLIKEHTQDLKKILELQGPMSAGDLMAMSGLPRTTFYRAVKPFEKVDGLYTSTHGVLKDLAKSGQ